MTTTLSQTGSQIQVDLNAVEAGNIGKTSITDLTDTTVAAAKKSGYHSLQASSSNAPSADRSVIVSAVRNTTVSGELRYGQVLLSESNKLYWNTDDGGVLGTWREAVSTAGGQTLTNKSITGGSLAINTISEESSGAGVTIDSVLLKDNTVLAGTLTAGAGSITDSSGAISFGNENLSTTGTLSVGGTLGVTGVLTGTSLDISGNIDVDGTTNLDIVDIDGAVDMASTLTVASNIVVGGTVDGRDVANDGTKLDGIEASADVTDTANVTAAGALMDSELTAIASVKALNQGVATGDSPQFVGITSTANVIVGGNLTVNGTTTTINTATLDVEDKNITVNYGAGDTTGSANGAGLTIQDAVDASTDATILWDTTNDEFDFSHPINVAGKVTGTGTSVFASLDISGDIDVDGTTNLDVVDIDGAVNMATTALVTGVLTTTATQVATGGITSGSNIVSDTDSTDDLGTTSVRWANLFVDSITATDQITATGFTGTLDGILGSGAAAAATVTTLDTSGAVNLNLVTDSSSSTSGALIVDGGVGIAKKLYVGTDLDVDGTTNLDIVDIDGAVDMASTLAVGGATTLASTLTMKDGNNSIFLDGRTDGGAVAGTGAANVSVIDGIYASNAIAGARIAFAHQGGAGQRGGLTFASKNTDDSSNQPTVQGVLTPFGYWGFGTTNPQYKVEVAGTLGVTGATTLTAATAINANIANPLTINASLNGIVYNEVFNINTGANAAAYFGIVTQNLANSGTIRSGMFFDSSNHLNFINGEAGGAGIVLDDNNAVTMSGSLTVTGALSGGGMKAFKIDHPLKPDTHQLVHSVIEAPQADLFYSGTSELVNGAAEVNIDEFHGMTEGTFVALNRNIRVFTTNETDWEPIKGSVIGNILSISCQDGSCSDKVSWLVIGERQDEGIKNSDLTDEQGRVIVEPLKPETEAFVEAPQVQRTISVPVMLDGERVEALETVDVPESIEVIDGVAVLTPATTEEVLKPQFEEIGVVDVDGNPVYG